MSLRAAAALTLLLTPPTPGQTPLEAAREVARWLENVSFEVDAERTWPWCEEQPRAEQIPLYSGVAGIVLFHVELAAATGETDHLAAARSGGRRLIAALDDPKLQAGLYTGLAGISFTLRTLAEATQDESFERAANRALEQLLDRSRPAGKGVEWTPVTDIISGNAGILLELLAAHEARAEPAILETATQAGERLLELAEPIDGGLRWPMMRNARRHYPNFSHGTAGVAFALARLAEATGDKSWLAAAMSGAHQLAAIADASKGERIHHHSPGGEQLFYLGWCHGPPGTSRLYAVLSRLTDDPTWQGRIAATQLAVKASGAPARRSPGFWNNEGVCCGTAGLTLFWSGVDSEAAQSATEALIGRARRDERGMRWSHAEHRVRPEDLNTQTGWMQGAAGIGYALLAVDAASQGRQLVVRLPDDPSR